MLPGFVRAVLVLSAVLPASVCAWLVLRFGVNIPFWDEWEWADLVYRAHTGTLTLADLWRQHNEHRLVFPQLAMLALDRLHGWNVIAEQLLSLACVAFTQYLIWLVIARTARGGARVAAFVLSGLALWNGAQAENFSWGFQMAWFICNLCLLGAIVLVSRPRRNAIELAAAVVLAVIASYSSAQGFLIWPAMLVALWTHPRRVAGSSLTVAVFATVTYAIYRHGLQPPAHGHVALSGHVGELTLYVSAYLGSPLAGRFGVTLSALAGAIMCATFAAFFVYDLRTSRLKHFARRAPWYAIATYAVAIAAATATGRAGFGLEQSLAGRYTTVSSLLVVALIGMLATVSRVVAARPRPTGARLGIIFACGAFVVLVGYSDLWGLRFWASFAQARAVDFTALKAGDGVALRDAYPDVVRETLLARRLAAIGDGPYSGRSRGAP